MFNAYSQYEFTRLLAIEFDYLFYNGITELHDECGCTTTERRFKGNVFELDLLKTYYRKTREYYFSAGMGMVRGEKYKGLITDDFYFGKSSYGNYYNQNFVFVNFEYGRKFSLNDYLVLKPSVNFGKIMKEYSELAFDNSLYMPGMGVLFGKKYFLGIKLGIGYRFSVGAKARKNRLDNKLIPLD